MKKILINVLVCALLLSGCAGVLERPQQAEDSLSQGFALDMEGSESKKVIAMYDKGYDSVEELMAESVVLVRAIPVAIEDESDVAVCFVLDVKESNYRGVETIRLRQIKDEYCLELGKEVVLALQPDVGEGYYNIPGGGCGLFRVDEETNKTTGVLMDSLLESAPQSYSAKGGKDLTLEQVYDLLVELDQAD